MNASVKADWHRAELETLLDQIGPACFFGRINSKVIDSTLGHAVLSDYFEEQDRPVGMIGFTLRALFGPTVA